MNSILPGLVLSDGDLSASPAVRARQGDDRLLDSYSKTIAAVVNRVAPTVVNIRMQSGERGQGGGLDARAFPAVCPMSTSPPQRRGSRGTRCSVGGANGGRLYVPSAQSDLPVYRKSGE